MTKQTIKVANGKAPDYSAITGMSDVYSFGDPEACLDNHLTDYIGVFADQQGIYEPPINLNGLVKLLRVNAQHGPILYFKRNMILKWFKQNTILSDQAMSKLAFDFLWSGNAYLQPIRNQFGQIIRLAHLPALTMRYTNKRGVYAQLRNNGLDPLFFQPNEIWHIKEYDPAQGIYGIPEYYGGVQSALLNEDATLFRRRYFKNGAHMGFIFSMSDPNLSEDDEKQLKDAIKNSKGVGNFRSLFFNFKSKGVDADKAIKITPVGDFSTKDEFEKIKRITLNDMLSMHRAQEALSGQTSGDSPGFGNLESITRAYYNNEVVPLQRAMQGFNRYLPSHQQIQFHVPEYSDMLSLPGAAA
ncbi:phage portal protein [Pseudoalteromonas luteoviolacea]|uniref:phage portal protein n=1 Tax=Pseudoalteromonas luteoviolacea TaxID=43657 RepID=UPI001B36F510|nr:phage portal protein [Pseudoalteromonas luteoviolacea]MBQ4836790.1 phage portal protein [Pseudoalteromonas luteoviolacea]